jgi:hypothetical protein
MTRCLKNEYYYFQITIKLNLKKMPINVKLLKEIAEVAGAPGHEQRIREIVIREVTPLVDEVTIDNMGNVYAIKKGKAKKRVMIGAHMDEIGFMVTHIDDDGFVRFHTLGGFDPKTLTAQRVIIHGKKDVIGVMGSKPIHVMSAEERLKLPKTTDFFIDLGMNKKEVEKIVSLGDPITRERGLIEMGNCVNCKSLDNRLAVFILIQFFRPEKNISKNEMNAMGTVMEIPVEVTKIIQTSCADCHSNSTNYPWYSEIAPVSWYLAQHVKEGKEHLNFSEWTNYNKDQQEHVLKDIKEVLNEREMPLKSYLLIHKDAKLTENQYQILYDWVNSIKIE